MQEKEINYGNVKPVGWIQKITEKGLVLTVTADGLEHLKSSEPDKYGGKCLGYMAVSMINRTLAGEKNDKGKIKSTPVNRPSEQNK